MNRVRHSENTNTKLANWAKEKSNAINVFSKQVKPTSQRKISFIGPTFDVKSSVSWF